MRVLFLASLLWTVAFAQEDRLVSLYERAKISESAGDYKTAVAAYEQIIQLRPDMAEAYANAGNLYYLQGDSAHAAPYFRKAIRLKPSLSGPHFFLGVLAFKARAYPEALKYLEEAIHLDGSNALIQAYLGYTYFALHHYADAARYLESAAKSTPEDIDVYYHLSKAYGNLAKSNFQDLQNKYPDSIYTALARAHLYESQESWELAAQQYDLALKRRPSDQHLQDKRDEMALRQTGGSSSPATARDETDGSLFFFYHPPAGAQIGTELETYQARVNSEPLKQAASAESLYQAAENYQILTYLANQWIFDLNPDSYRAHQIKGQYYEDLNNNDEKAIAEYRRAAELSPDLPNIHFLIGNLYWRREKPDEALPELLKQLDIDPSHPEALYEVGDIRLSKGQFAEAEQCFLKSLSGNPEMEEPHLALARIYTEKHQDAKALLHLRKASEINPKDPTPHYKLSMLYKTMGRGPESQAELRTFGTLKGNEPATGRK